MKCMSFCHKSALDWFLSKQKDKFISVRKGRVSGFVKKNCAWRKRRHLKLLYEYVSFQEYSRYRMSHYEVLLRNVLDN